MGSKTLKRLISSVLSLSILCTQFVTMPVLAETNEPESLTEGQIVLNNYEGPALTEAEKNVMLDVNVDSNKVSFVAPTDDDGLLTLDGNTLVAADYTDSEGNLWVPVSAVLKEDGEADVEIDLSTGAFEPKTNSYSVEVVYETYTTVSAEKQTKLLNLAHNFVSGIESVETLVNDGVNSLAALTRTVNFDGKDYSISNCSMIISLPVKHTIQLLGLISILHLLSRKQIQKQRLMPLLICTKIIQMVALI